jgi:hypothetical protein
MRHAGEARPQSIAPLYRGFGVAIVHRRSARRLR